MKSGRQDMRYFISNDIRKNRPLKAILIWMLLFLIPFWVTNALFYFRIGFSPTALTRYYRGDPSSFRSPRPLYSFIEETHFHTFAMAILLMTLLHLLLFTSIRMKFKLFLVHTTFGSAFFDLFSNWAIRYIHPFFSYLKISSALIFEISLGFILVLLLWNLVTKPISYPGINRANGSSGHNGSSRI